MGRSAYKSKVQRKRGKVGFFGDCDLETGASFGHVGPKSMLDLREIGDRRGGGISVLVF